MSSPGGSRDLLRETCPPVSSELEESVCMSSFGASGLLDGEGFSEASGWLIVDGITGGLLTGFGALGGGTF